LPLFSSFFKLILSCCAFFFFFLPTLHLPFQSLFMFCGFLFSFTHFFLKFLFVLLSLAKVLQPRHPFSPQSSHCSGVFFLFSNQAVISPRNSMHIKYSRKFEMPSIHAICPSKLDILLW
jgi:hypothetical protein